MDGLAAFWAARLDEDEAYLRTMIDVGERAAARATPLDTADAYGVAMTVLSDPRARQIVEERMVNPVPPPNDLKRLLREVEAWRTVLAEWRDHTPVDDDYSIGLRFALKAKAAVYADHPDYPAEP